MKQALFTIAAAALCSAASAQDIYFKAGLGYAFPAMGQTLTTQGELYNGTVTYSGNSSTFSAKPMSLNSGFHGALGIGAMLGKYVAVELNADFGLVTKTYTSETRSATTTISTMKHHAKLPVVLNPSIVLQAPVNEAFVYTRLGVALPINARVTIENEYRMQMPPNTTYYSSDMKMRFTPGFTGALGFKGAVAKNIMLFGECNFMALTLYTKESEVKEYTINGIDRLSTISSTNRVTKYSKEGVQVSGTTNNVQEAYSMPYSYFGIMAGVQFVL